MEINGTIKARVTNIQLKADETNDGQAVVVDVETKLTPEDAEAKFGEAFRHVAFACMRDIVDLGEDGDATITQFGYSSKKPPKWLRPSVHNVDLWGTKDKIQPKILKIVAGDNERAVVVHLRFVVATNAEAEVIGALGAVCGKEAKIKLKALQSAAVPVQKPPKKGPKQTLANVPVKSTAQKRQPAPHLQAVT